VLKVREPKSGCLVHLVGVAHGSSASATLVEEVIEAVRPANVVVELCVERFLSISLESRIRPRGNETMSLWFDEKVKLLENEDKVKRWVNMVNFVRAQGAVAGLFVLMGLSVTALQKAARLGTAEKKSDEFVTAMKVAERLAIPLSLGDAPQTETLNAVRRGVFSRELIEPQSVSEGAQLLLFSVLGRSPYDSSPQLGDVCGREVLEKSEWLSIPKAYLDPRNRKMLQGLAPIFAIFVLTTLLGAALPYADALADPVVAPILTTSPVPLPTTGLGSAVLSILTSPIPAPVEQAVNIAVDLFSVLLLVRLTKLIGTDRDTVIAKKVQQVCAQSKPGSEVVVVIGMLHANGVARWLLSGKDPELFDQGRRETSFFGRN